MISELKGSSTSKKCSKCNSLSRKYHLHVFDSQSYLCRACNRLTWYADDWEKYIARINHLLKEFPVSQSERDFLEQIRSTTQLHWEERMRLLCIEYRMTHDSAHINNLIEEQSEILITRMMRNKNQ